MVEFRLDIMTLLVLLILGYLMLAILLMLHESPVTSKRAVRVWTLAQSLKAVGAFGVLVAFTLDNTPIRIGFNLFLIFGFALEFAAYQVYTKHQRPYLIPMYLGTLASMVFLAGGFFESPWQGQYWAATAALSFGVMSAGAAYVLFRWSTAQTHRSAYVAILIAVNFMNFVISAIRAWYAVIIDGHNFVTPVLTNELMFLWNYVLLLLNGIGFILLLKEQSDRLMADLTIRDPLTGLFNRRHFDTELRLEISRFERGQSSFALAMIDLDHFKQINDLHGHQTGDWILTEFGQFMQKQCRDIDIFARIGGEEFALILPNASMAQAKEKLESLQHQLTNHEFVHRGKRIRITFSAGVTDSNCSHEFDGLMMQADDALYEAKANGRDSVCGWRFSNPSGLATASE